MHLERLDNDRENCAAKVDLEYAQVIACFREVRRATGREDNGAVDAVDLRTLEVAPPVRDSRRSWSSGAVLFTKR